MPPFPWASLWVTGGHYGAWGEVQPSLPPLWGPGGGSRGPRPQVSVAWPLPSQIIHTDSNTVLGQNDTGFSCDGSASTFRVMFKEPVEVLPNVNYTACATLKVCLTLTLPRMQP